MVTSTFGVALGGAAGVALGFVLGMHLARMPERNRVERWLRTVVCIAAGAPPLAFALMMPYATLQRAFAALVLVFPLVTMMAEILVRRVPREVSDAALALGVPRWRALLIAVLPCAWPQIARGVAIVFTVVLFHLQGSFYETDAGGSLGQTTQDAITSLRLLVWTIASLALYALLRPFLSSLKLFR